MLSGFLTTFSQLNAYCYEKFYQGPEKNRHESLPVATHCRCIWTDLTGACADGIGFIAWSCYQDGLYVRNIYDQNTGTSINNKTNAGSWPADILSSSKIYGLNSPSITEPFY